MTPESTYFKKHKPECSVLKRYQPVELDHSIGDPIPRSTTNNFTKMSILYIKSVTKTEVAAEQTFNINVQLLLTTVPADKTYGHRTYLE